MRGPKTLRVGEPFNPYRLFTGIFIPDALVRYDGISASAKLLYGRLARYAGEDGRCFPSQATLARDLGMSDRNIRNLLHELEEAGFLRSVQHGLHRTNSYVFLWHAALASCFKSKDRKNGAVQGRKIPSGQGRKVSSSKESQGNESHPDESLYDSMNRSVPLERGRRPLATFDSPEEIPSGQPQGSRNVKLKTDESEIAAVRQTLFEGFGDRLGYPDPEISTRIFGAGRGAPAEQVCLVLRRYAQALRDDKKPAPRNYGLLLEHVRCYFIAHPPGGRARRASKSGERTQPVRRKTADGIEYV